MVQELSIAPHDIQILNYAPGPLETDMATEIWQAPLLDASLKPHYDKQLVDPDDSAARLVQLLLQGNFTSGQHIDYYDLLVAANDDDSKAAAILSYFAS
jgi:sepiapterin reductase